MKKSFQTHSPGETKNLASRVGKLLRVGDVILLVADLGGGKTTFAQGVLRGLGIKENVLSPTFILAQSFVGRRLKRKVPVHHLDFYRLTKKEILAMGVQDYLAGSGDIERGVLLIEWADKLKEIWPEDRMIVQFEIGNKPNERKIFFKAQGKRHLEILKILKTNL